MKKEEQYINKLKEAEAAYYSGNPILSDLEYDLLYDEFKKLYPKSSYFQTVGTSSLNKTKLVKHSILMGSLLKVNTLTELEFWYKKYAQEKNVLWSEKIDGLSVSLFYENGIFKQAITRGDGEIGEDITSNALKMNFKKELKNKFTGFIRGEIVLEKQNFEKHFSEKSNPRNVAAGLVRRLDGEGSEHLSIYVYFIEKNEDEKEKFSLLKKLGLQTPNFGLCKNLDEIQKIWEKYENGEREKIPYETDGICLYVNSVADQNELGIIDNRPRFARAYKFSPQSAVSKIESITWQVGRTGRITPVAQITPVNVAGAVISNVSLHNLAEIKRKNMSLGGVIHVERKGDVIPQITKCVNTAESKEIVPIKKCPSCESKLVIKQFSNKKVQEDAFLFCVNNENCKEIRVQSLLFWIKTLDIKGFGDKMVEKLYDQKKVSQIIDFYSLKEKDLEEMERSGEKLSKKLIQELNDKKEVFPELFIKALGFDGFGEKDMKIILEKYSFNEIFSLKFEDFENIHGIGKETAIKIVAGLAERKKEIFNLLKIIKLKEKKQGVLSGKSFCFSEIRDKNLEQKIKDLGGSISDSVNKNLTCLIVKSLQGTSSKIEKAKKNNIPIIEIKDVDQLF